MLENLHHSGADVLLDSNSLYFGDAVAVANLEILKRYLYEGRYIYGVGTGKRHNAEILRLSGCGEDCTATLKKPPFENTRYQSSWFAFLSLFDATPSCGAVRLEVVQAKAELAERDLTPVIRLRGSISASGDLTSLAYIADLGALHHEFFMAVRPLVERVTLDALERSIPSSDYVALTAWNRLGLSDSRDKRSRLDICDQAMETAATTVDRILDFITTRTSAAGGAHLLSRRQQRKKLAEELLNIAYNSARRGFLSKPSTPENVCSKARQVYKYARRSLNILIQDLSVSVGTSP
ncbi:hypothetical protein CI102_651 [Trichoderma harzianum]|nr:hypothetical protein CI102_651 [Trichoderma harzianum]